MSQAWCEWYGDSLSEPDPMFWASKLHFYISGLSFYNFPYLFGYLFSTAVHQISSTWGDDTYDRYTALLRDTGSMDAGELAQTHLGVNLEEPAFWSGVIERFEPRIANFERLVSQG
jgi:oligoendopeptidase F